AAEAVEIDLHQPAGDQLTEYRTPLLLAQLLADPVGGQVLVSGAADLLVIPSQQYVHQMSHSIALSAAVDGGQGHAGGRAAVPGALRFQEVVTVPAGLFQGFSEIARQRLPPAAGKLTHRQHGVELVPLDALV